MNEIIETGFNNNHQLISPNLINLNLRSENGLPVNSEHLKLISLRLKEYDELNLKLKETFFNNNLSQAELHRIKNSHDYKNFMRIFSRNMYNFGEATINQIGRRWLFFLVREETLAENGRYGLTLFGSLTLEQNPFNNLLSVLNINPSLFDDRQLQVVLALKSNFCQIFNESSLCNFDHLFPENLPFNIDYMYTGFSNTTSINFLKLFYFIYKSKRLYDLIIIKNNSMLNLFQENLIDTHIPPQMLISYIIRNQTLVLENKKNIFNYNGTYSDLLLMLNETINQNNEYRHNINKILLLSPYETLKDVNIRLLIFKMIFDLK